MEQLSNNWNSSLVSILPEAQKFQGLFSEPELRMQITFLKAILLTKGVAIDGSARSEIWSGRWKAPRMVRSGMSGGLEFYLVSGRYKIAVSCLYSLEAEGDGLVLIHDGQKFYLSLQGEIVCEVELVPQPSYYALNTTSGKKMASVAQQCFSKLAIGVYGSCAFNRNPQTACAFCAIHAAKKTDSPNKNDDEIFETVQAVADSELGNHIETIMLGGGTPNTPDKGANRFASLSVGLTKIVPWRLTAMLVPPKSATDLRRLHDAGVKEVSINLEFGSDKAFVQFTPGKAGLIGRRRYFDCLEEAVKIFGVGNVQSLLVTGLESTDDTLWAVNWLAERGIIPVLSPFRPLPFTLLEKERPPAVNDVLSLYFEARKVVARHKMFLGPRCAPCQCNTMALPWDVPNSFIT